MMALKIFDATGVCVAFHESHEAGTPLEMLSLAYAAERKLALSLGEVPGRRRVDGADEEQ